MPTSWRTLDIIPCFVARRRKTSSPWRAGSRTMWPSTRTWRSGTTTHGGLVEVQPHVFGRRVFAQFVFGTGDAMGLTHEWAAEWN
jgi:hypothetical protein